MKLESQWIVGFVDGEAYFNIDITENKTCKTGYQVLPEFVIIQHEREVNLLHAIKSFFGCGVVRRDHADRMCFRVRKFEHLSDIILPFFEKHHLKSLKKVEFLKFRKVILLMKEDKHLRLEGLEEIQNIKAKKFKIESSPLRREEGDN